MIAVGVLDAPMECVKEPTAFAHSGWKSGTLKIIVAIVGFVAVFALTLIIYLPHSPLGKQEANLRLASLHVPIIESRLR